MHHKSDLWGVLAMLGSTAVFVLGDTFLKSATDHMPPLEALALRNVAGSVACLALVRLRGESGAMAGALDARALLRALGETLGALLYVVALARMPIADLLAIMQTAPLMLMIGAAMWLRERIGPARMALALAGFGGAILVAQPGAAGATTSALLAFGSALFIAGRDLVGRGVPAHIPVPVVALTTMAMEGAGAGAASLALETSVWPSLGPGAGLAFAGVCAVAGQVGVLLAYRLGRTATVAPFFYSFVLWGIVAGIFVWGQAPNALAFVGIALIVASGIAIVLRDQREGRAVALTEAI